MKLVSWNVNGLRACVTKGFMDYYNESQADIFCVQETKLQAGQIEMDLGEDVYQYWNYAVKKDTPAQPYLPGSNRYLSGMESRKIANRKAE